MHLAEHTRAPGSHINESLIITFTQNQRTEQLPRLLEKLRDLQRLEHDIVKHLEAIVNCIQIEASKALKTVQELQKIVIDLITKNEVQKIDYEAIDYSIKDLLGLEKIEEIKNRLRNLFEFNLKNWKECNEVIFSRSKKTGELLSIDLQTFQISNLNFIPEIGRCSQASKINQNTYFFYGGLLRNPHGEAFLINIKERNFEILQRGSIRYTGASAFKDDKIYIFGGCSTGFDKLDTCSTYDLKKKEWKTINSLPVPCYNMTAAVVGKVIVLSGEQMNCCYAYNDSVFAKILKLPSGIGKVVCGGWIFCNSILYENKDENITDWVRHNVNNPWDSFLLVSTTFKKGQYFYFIDGKDSLMRIDTELKKFEKIDRDKSCVIY